MLLLALWETSGPAFFLFCGFFFFFFFLVAGVRGDDVDVFENLMKAINPLSQKKKKKSTDSENFVDNTERGTWPP